MNLRDVGQSEPEPARLVSAVIDDDAPEAATCTLCGGPARLCGGARRCTGFFGAPRTLRWLTALRATYAGLVLTRTVAALWGGTLLRFGRLLAAGVAPPRSNRGPLRPGCQPLAHKLRRARRRARPGVPPRRRSRAALRSVAKTTRRPGAVAGGPRRARPARRGRDAARPRALRPVRGPL